MYSVQVFNKRLKTVFNNSQNELLKKADQQFIRLFIVQGLFAIGLSFAYFIKVNPTHFFIAAGLSIILSLVPVYYCSRHAGKKSNGYVSAIFQMMFSLLFIHLCDGRIEAHFHIFGSLVFLALYRNWKVILLASVMVPASKLLGGQFMAALELSGWILFQGYILCLSIKNSLTDLHAVATHQVKFEDTMNSVAEEICSRTRELVVSERKVMTQQEALIQSAKMGALGEMAGGIAHEINNPLTIISTTCSFLKKLIAQDKLDPAVATKCLDQINSTILRMAKIIQGLKTVSRDTSSEEFSAVKLRDLMDDCLGLCTEKFKEHGVHLIVDLKDPVFDGFIECRRVQMSQIFINLLGNAFDAVEHLEEKWVRVECRQLSGNVEFRIIDSGAGIPKDIQQKVFQPFFTTKPVGKGTGLGLSLSISIVKAHDGEFKIDDSNPNTCFIISLPDHRKKAA